MRLHISQLHPTKPFCDHDRDHLLEESIKKEGVKKEIHIAHRPNKDGTRDIKDGHHRYYFAIKYGIEYLECETYY